MNKSSLTNSDGPMATFADENVNETVRLKTKRKQSSQESDILSKNNVFKNGMSKNDLSQK